MLAPVFSVNAGNSVKIPNKIIKILLVPGHDNEVWGAQYGNIKEADMNLVLATQIYNLLKKDKRFEVYITRNKAGYTKTFSDYISSNKEDIISFKEDAKKEMKDKISNGNFIQKANVPHVSVSEDTSIKLYGINKWANENKIDAVIHVHFNDYSRPGIWAIGKYKGFSIYVPEAQMANFKGSTLLASNIFNEISKKYNISNYDKESKGIIPEQKLIAMGSFGTLDKNVNSVLIEYGYIYQKIFRNTTTRHAAYKNMASLTTKGIQNYFFTKQ